MNKILSKSLTAGLLWGIIGGVLLILMERFSQRGPIVMLLYPLILISALSTFKPPGEKNIITYFKAGLYTFMVMTLVLYLEIIFIENPDAAGMPVIGHVWPIAVMLLIGSLSSFILSFLILFIKQLKKNPT